MGELASYGVTNGDNSTGKSLLATHAVIEAQHQDFLTIFVADKLPPFSQDVLVVMETKQEEFIIREESGDEHVELSPSEPRYCRIGRLMQQFKTSKPFWVAAWDHEPLEGVYLVVTHWAELELPA